MTAQVSPRRFPRCVAASVLFGALLLVASHAHSQCEIKRYQDMLVVSAGPGCLGADGGRESIASGVKQVVNELNEVSRAEEARERRRLSSRDKLYRLAEFQHHDNMLREVRIQNEIRQNNRLAHQQRGLD